MTIASLCVLWRLNKKNHLSKKRNLAKKWNGVVMNVPFLHFFSLCSFINFLYFLLSPGAVKGVECIVIPAISWLNNPPSLLQFVEVRTSLTVLSTFFYNLSSGGEGKGSSGKQVKNILSLFAHSKYESKNPLKWFVSVSKWQLIRSSNNLSPWVDSLDSVASFLQYCWLIELQIWKI